MRRRDDTSRTSGAGHVIDVLIDSHPGRIDSQRNEA
jgi:hypothetical protein